MAATREMGTWSVQAAFPRRITVIALHGALDADAAASLHRCIVGGVQDGADVVLDLSDTATVDCATLGSVVRADRAARGAGRWICFAGPSSLVRRTLGVTAVDTILPVFHDRTEAVSRLVSAAPRDDHAAPR